VKHRHRKRVGIPLVIILLALGAWSLSWGVASLYLWRAAEALQLLDSESIPVNDKLELLTTINEHLDRAQRYGGNHPDLHDRRGQALFWQAVNLAEAGEPRGELLARAAEQYREALKLRPLWPYFWANLVVAKAEWGIFDQEFRQAVRRTVETGPFEPRVQLQLIRVDFIEQERLDRRSRAHIEEMLQRAMQTQPSRVLALAKDLNQLPRVCGMIPEELRNWQCSEVN
jgi:hypothetical protein